MKFAIRSLLRTPGFTVVAILTLALGIGANSAIFTIVDSVLLRPLPYPEPHRLFHVVRALREGGFIITLSGLKYRGLLDGLASAESMAAYTRGGANIATDGFPERILRVFSTWQLFDVFGVKPVAGRFFTPEDEMGVPVVVLSNALWQRRFGGDAGVIGRSIIVEGAPATIIGVAPAGFDLGFPADLFRPFHIAGGPDDSGNQYTTVMRLALGVSERQALEELRTRELPFREQFPGEMDDKESIGLRTVAQVRTGNVRLALLLLLGAAGLVLLIACANVANLLLARSSARSREFSIRSALGATRGRIVRQLLTEGFLLSLTASVAGLLIASWGLSGLLTLIPETFPRASEVSIDWRVIGVTLGLSVLTTLVFALAPALGSSRPALADALRESRASAGATRRRVRNALVVVEIGLCTVLLIGSALLIQTFLRLRSVDPGFDPAPVLTFKMSIPEKNIADAGARESLYRRLVDRIEAIPGIESAAATTEFPLNGGPDLPVEIDGRQGEDSPIVMWQAVTPHVFQAIGIPLKRGRIYDHRDVDGSAPVAIVNEAFVRAFKLQENPVGQRIVIAPTMGPKWMDGPRAIVGVVGDVKTYALHRPATPTVYLPVSQVRYITNSGSWVVRVRGNPSGLPKLIEREVQAVDPLLPVSQFRPMEEIVNRTISQRRFNMFLLSLFGGLALVLAVIGIYGVTSYTVTQRTQEIGIRMALGASVRDTLQMVLRESLILGVAGVALGIIGSLALTQLLRGLLYGVSATDPTTFVATALCLVGVALLATLIPARRAASIDPIQALRYE